jgi:DNA polymerase
MPAHNHNADRQRRIAAQTIETGSLLGIDFAPLAPTSPPLTPATPSRDADEPPAPAAPAAEVEAKPQHTPSPSKAARIKELRDRYADDPSTAAHLIEGWNNIVFGDGDPDAARLMFIGEAPGADEDAQGIPFVGRAGQKLNEMIRAMGLSRETVYIANVLKVRPPNNRDPSESETAADGPYLREQIDILQPAAIVTLGRPASQFVLGSKQPMGKLRGTLHQYNGIPVSPTYHPAYLLRAYTPENRRKVWADLQLAMSVLNADTP